MPIPQLNFLKTSNKTIIYSSGKSILLHGINLGNLFLIEPWMTAIQGAPDYQSMIDLLTKRFGNTNLLEIFEKNYIQKIDYDNLAKLKINLVRLPFYYQQVQNSQGKFNNFAKLDKIIENLAQKNIYTLLDLHGAPGGQSNEMHCGQSNRNELFAPSTNGKKYRKDTINLWRALAEHYKHNPYVMAYGLLNEPFGALEHDKSLNKENGLWPLYDNIYQAIRAVDKNHIIVMSSIPSKNDWDTLPNPQKYKWQNIVYEFHYYAFKFDIFGKINGTLDANKHKKYLAEKIKKSQQESYNVPVLIGEFNGFDKAKNWQDYLDTFQKLDWHYTVWSYKHNKLNESWGLYTSSAQEKNPPNILLDSEAELKNKFSLYNTCHYTENKLVSDFLKK